MADSWTEREIGLAQFTHLVSLSGIEAAIIEAIGEATEEWAATSRLRFFRRRRLDREGDALYRLLRCIHDYMREQEQA